MLFKLFFILFAAGLILFWWHSAQVHELAITSARKTCERCNVQFLDHTVARESWKLSRGAKGKWQFERNYKFEFSADGMNRYSGNVHTIANRVTAVIMEPYPED